jgi:hypothetical protein
VLRKDLLDVITEYLYFSTSKESSRFSAAFVYYHVPLKNIKKFPTVFHPQTVNQHYLFLYYEGTHLSTCLSVCLSVRLSTYLRIYLSERSDVLTAVSIKKAVLCSLVETKRRFKGATTKKTAIFIFTYLFVSPPFPSCKSYFTLIFLLVSSLIINLLFWVIYVHVCYKFSHLFKSQNSATFHVQRHQPIC